MKTSLTPRSIDTYQPRSSDVLDGAHSNKPWSPSYSSPDTLVLIL